MQENLFVAARKASGVTQHQAAEVSDVSVGTYAQRERRPQDFRLGELAALYDVYGDGAKTILLDAVRSFFCRKS